jgi:hypothetical protein
MTRFVDHSDHYRSRPKRGIIPSTMSTIGDKAIPALRALHDHVMDFADSLAPKSQGQDSIEDFEDVINQLTETTSPGEGQKRRAAWHRHGPSSRTGLPYIR